MAVMGRPRKFGKTTTFGFDLDVSEKGHRGNHKET